MGSIRTWSLAAVAGVLVVVVAHQRSDAGAAEPLAAAAAGVGSYPAAPAAHGARVTGLPDFSELVAENGASVVNISVVVKPGKGGGDGEDGAIRCPSSFTIRRSRVPITHPPRTASAPVSSFRPTATS